MDPLTCKDLIARRLASEAHCCSLCHHPELTGYFGTAPGMRAVIIRLPEGDIEAELCCSQAMSVNAHELVKDWTVSA